ncbi:MAG: hypothetical protein KDD43_00175 [Bdellovibrionales bacterium]|nr:hypothetical protein [Bdellovibrionales bacterium]
MNIEKLWWAIKESAKEVYGEMSPGTKVFFQITLATLFMAFGLFIAEFLICLYLGKPFDWHRWIYWRQ